VLRVACCVLRVACCVLRVACCVLRVACCVLRVACCVLRFAFCVLRFACMFRVVVVSCVCHVVYFVVGVGTVSYVWLCIVVLYCLHFAQRDTDNLYKIEYLFYL
jgi:hypothetical protein